MVEFLRESQVWPNVLVTKYGYMLVRTSELVRQIAERRDLKSDRHSLQRLGDALDLETEHKWVFDEVIRLTEGLPESAPVVVDCVRTAGQLKHFRSFRGFDVVHAHLYAPAAELTERFQKAHPTDGF